MTIDASGGIKKCLKYKLAYKSDLACNTQNTLMYLVIS